jgi:hypothetical protein
VSVLAGNAEAFTDCLVTHDHLDAVAKSVRRKWLDVGLNLGISYDFMQEYRLKEPESLYHRLLAVLCDWKSKEDNPTVRTLLKACEKADVGGDAKRALQTQILGEI